MILYSGCYLTAKRAPFFARFGKPYLAPRVLHPSAVHHVFLATSFGDLCQHDMGTGLPFRPATFDGCISVSALQVIFFFF